MMTGDRRAVAIGAAVLIVAVLALRVVPRGVELWRSRVRELAARTELLERSRAQVLAGAALTDSVPAIRERFLGLAPRILTGATDVEAADDLSGRVTLAAERARARVERTVPVPDSTRAGWLRRVTLRTTLETDTRGLLTTLRTIASDSAVLVVDRASVIASDPFTIGGGPEVLKAELTVHGWYLARGARP